MQQDTPCAASTDRGFAAKVTGSLQRLERWIVRNGWAGYDPYDLKGMPFYMWALGLPKSNWRLKLARKAILGPLLLGETFFPKLCRLVVRAKPTVNAKGMALFAKAYLQLYTTTRDEKFKQRALECLRWLNENRSKGYPCACWGYPFDWQSGVVVPAGTPASVVTAAACDAYWTAWQVLGERSYLDVCAQCCEFFLEYLKIDVLDDRTVCFSYTPLDDFHVHNTNLLVAELLVRVGMQLGRQDWVEMGLRAGNYALSEQNEDGSLFYWGRIQNHMNPGRVDHYHAGFEIRCLHAIWKHTGREDYRRAAEKYYAFYRKNLIQYEPRWAVPKMYPHALYPINIHSCAEALILNASLSDDYPEAGDLLKGCATWVIENMQHTDGHFIALRQRMFGLEMKSRIAYLRWGQAWMLLALSSTLQAQDVRR